MTQQDHLRNTAQGQEYTGPKGICSCVFTAAHEPRDDGMRGRTVHFLHIGENTQPEKGSKFWHVPQYAWAQRVTRYI